MAKELIETAATCRMVCAFARRALESHMEPKVNLDSLGLGNPGYVSAVTVALISLPLCAVRHNITNARDHD